MLIDDADQLGGEADVLVVGAGAVGLTLAIRLARQGRRVLVLEAGRAAMRAGGASEMAARDTGRPHGGLADSRHRGLGGTTRLWGGQLAAFDAADLAPDLYHGKPGWPVDHATLSGWTEAAVSMLGLSRDWARAAAWRARMDAGGEEDLRAELTLWLRQPDFTRLFAAEIADPAGPAIRVEQEVEGLYAQGDRIAGVWVRGADGQRRPIRARHIVLAAGTADNARLLLRAQAALPAAPLAANAHVGRWFFDHLHGPAGAIVPLDRAALSARFDTQYRRGAKAVPKLRGTAALRRRRGVSAAALTVNTRWLPGHAWHDTRALARRIWQPGSASRLGAVRDTLRGAAVLAPLAWRYLAQGRSAHFRGGSAALGLELEQIPTADSYLHLEHGVPADRARIALHWALDGREVDAAAAHVEALGAWLARSGIGRLEVEPGLAARAPSTLDALSHASHQMGGARMAAVAADGVVDPDGAVWGMPGLWVAGASTFPSGGFANPTLTAIALGLRLADTVARRC